MAWYKSGTCSVTSGSPTVTGTGTAWVDNVRIGSDGFVGPDGLLYEISKVVSATEIILAVAYKGTTAASGRYAVAPIQGYTKELADKAAALIDQFSDAEATAASSASAAASSASAASNSATAAASSASAASASETNAKNSETNAASSAAAAATSETKIAAAVTQAVTQAVAEAKLAAHPVGSYYWSSESTDPSALFGPHISQAFSDSVPERTARIKGFHWHLKYHLNIPLLPEKASFRNYTFPDSFSFL